MQGRAQIRRRDCGDIAQDMIEFVLGDFNRDNCGRQICGKSLRDVWDLGKAGVWVEHIEGAEPVVPILECTHQSKRRRLSYPVHAVALVDDMTSSAVQQRQCLALNRIAVKCRRGRRCRNLNLPRENRCPVGLKRIDRALSNVRPQPVCKKHGPLGIGRRDMPYFAKANKNGDAAITDHNITTLCDLRDPDPMFERKAWQKVLQKTGFADLGGRREREIRTLGLRHHGQHSTKKKTVKFHAEPFAAMYAT